MTEQKSERTFTLRPTRSLSAEPHRAPGEQAAKRTTAQ